MTKYLLIACVILVALLAGSGWLLKNSYEENGQLKTTIEANRIQYEQAIAEANRTIDGLRAQRQKDQQQILALGKDNNRIRSQVDKEKARLNKFRSSLEERTLRKPAVTKRAARMALRRQQCETWRITGGTGACPK